MMTEEEILDLLQRMDDRTPSTSSDQSISWLAHRDAEDVNDPALIPCLKQLLESTKKKEIRRHIYFILSQIGRNFKDIEVAHILYDRLDAETDKHILSGLLSALAGLPQIPNCGRIVALTKDNRWLVRESAISALKNCKPANAEDALLEVLKTSGNTYDLIFAIASLGVVGSWRAIPDLIAMTNHRSNDVKNGAVSAFREIAARESALEVSTLVTMLQNVDIADAKWYAMSALNKFGDETAIAAVCARLETISAKKRKVWQTPKSELLEAVDFLARFDSDPAVQKLFDKIRCQRWEMLFEYEKQWLRENIKCFVQG